MRSLSSIWMAVSAVLVWITYASAFFVVESPGSNGTQYTNNAAYAISWQKGANDGVFGFDLEMTRMKVNGLYLIARNVLSGPGSINVFFQDIPPANDYHFLLINSTTGLVYAVSGTFSVLAADATPSVTPPSPSSSVPTVTVSGTPIPTPLFATTFDTLPSGAVTLLTSIQINALLLSLLSCAFGASLTLGW